MTIQNMEGVDLWQCSVSFSFLFQLFICATLEENLKERVLYLACDGGWSQEVTALLKHWNKSSRKKSCYPTVGPGYAAGFQCLVCIHQYASCFQCVRGYGAFSVRLFALGRSHQL